MNSSDMSILSKQMESLSMTTHRVIRNNKRLPQLRYSPYTKETNLTNYEKQKEEAVRLGVDLSLSVAEAMFLLSDDMRYMLLFCHWILKHAGNKEINAPVVGRLFSVILYVCETYFKPKSAIYQEDGGKSKQWELIAKSWQNFIFGVRELNRFFLILRDRKFSFGGVVKPSDFERYNQELKKLEETLRSSKDVSAEANGFAREAIKTNVLFLWNSLFEAAQPKVIHPSTRILQLFRSLFNQPTEDDYYSFLATLHK